MCNPREVPDIEEPLVEETVHFEDEVPLTEAMLAAASPQEQKNMFGERIFPRVLMMYPNYTPKITGMLLELDNSLLWLMLQHHDYLEAKAEEAMAVLQAHQARRAAAIQAENE